MAAGRNTNMLKIANALMLLQVIFGLVFADNEDTVVSYVEPKGTVCLECPIPFQSDNTKWTMKNGSKDIELFSRDVTKYSIKNLFLRVRDITCDSDKYTLEVYNITIDLNDGIYTCWIHQTSLAHFLVLVRGLPTVTISQEYSARNKTTDGKLECVITKAIAPYYISWLVNGSHVKDEYIQEPLKTTVNKTSNLSINLTSPVGITCAIYGIYIRNASDYMSLAPDPSNNTESSSAGIAKFLPIIVLMLFIVSMLTSFHLYYRAKRVDKNRLRTEHIEQRLHVGERGDGTVVYDVIDNEGSISIYHTLSKGAENSTHGTSLVVRVKTSGVFEYWNGTYSQGEPKIITPCFAKTLSGSATMIDASAFQSLARKLSSLKDHRSMLKMLYISVDEIPYSIFYEYMECGSLRDFMMRHYQEARQSRALSETGEQGHELMKELKKQQSELIYFASRIVDGMKFICSQQFCHPAVRLKKVLISEYCECKLYDICPTETAMKKVEEQMKKEHPPVAWLAPETMFLQEYTHASDVWGFGVLLWEIFSLGEVPLARLTKSEIEHRVREGVVLPQTLNCPGAVYGIMLSSWSTNQRKRPTFDTIAEKINSLAKELQQDSESSRKLVFLP